MRLDKMTITAVWSFSVVFMFWGLSADDASDKVSRWRRNEGGSGGDNWSNSSNWSDGRVPGRCKNGDSISGEAGWTAIFDGGNRWLVRTSTSGDAPYSISNVIFTSGTSVKQLGQGDYDQLPLEPGGSLTVVSGRNANLSVYSKIGIRDMDTSSSVIHIRNDSAAARLTLAKGFGGFSRAVGNTSFCFPRIQFEGCGEIRLAASFASPDNFHTDAVMAMDEGGRLCVTNTVKNLRTLRTMDNGFKQRVEIAPEAELWTGAAPSAPQVNATSDIEIFGDGKLVINAQGGIDCGFKPQNMSVMEISCSLAQRNEQSDASFLINGGGIVRLKGDNSIPQNPHVKGEVVLESATVGMSGEPSNIGVGDGITLENGGTFRYTGNGETTDRKIEIGYGTNVLEQAGTGSLVITGSLTSHAWQGEIVLSNDTDVAATYAGPILAGNQHPIVRKRGKGEWILSGENTTQGMFYLEGGTLAVGTSSSLPRLTVAGGGTLKILDGVTLTLTSKRFIREFGTVDVRPGKGAKFFVSDAVSGPAPEWLTFCGRPARYKSTGELDIGDRGLVVNIR